MGWRDDPIAQPAKKPKWADDPVVEQAPEMTFGEKAADVAASLGTGIVRGTAGLIGMPADIGRGAANLLIRGGGYLVGANQEKLAQDAARAETLMSGQTIAAPTTAEVMGGVERVTGPMYTPRGTAGEYAQSIGEFGASALAGPGGAVRKAAMAVVPGVMSEAAGQATEGTAYEPAARLVGGVVGGVAAAGRGSGAAKAMQETAPDLAAVNARKSNLYRQLENSGVTFDGYDYAIFADRLTRRLQNEAFDPNLQPKTAVLLARMNQLSGRPPTFQELDNLRKMAGNILRGSGEPSDMQFASKIMREIDDFFDSGVVSSANPQLPAGQVNTAVKEARELSRRAALARDINAMDRKSPYYQGGIENEFRKYMRSRRGERLTAAEKNAFDAVALRENLMDYATNKAGPVTGGVVGGFGGGPVGAVVGAGLTAGAQAAVKKIADASTAKQVEAALKTVLAGRAAQNQMLRDAAVDAANNRLRAIITAGMAVQNSENRNAMAR
ncbi:MAG: hypothetical protein ABFD94_01815 [Armatimonadia bacterium]